MKLSKVVISVLMLSMLGLTACGKKSSGSKVSDGRAVRTNTVGGSTIISNNGQTSAYLTSQNSGQFQELMKTLVSPTLDPQYLGTVDAYSGVRIGGKIQLAQAGGIYQNSSFGLEIHDSYVGQSYDGQTIQPYFINLSNAQGNWSGTSANGQINATFQDQYGTLKVTGSWNSSYFTGTVSFRNSTNTQSTTYSSQCSQGECQLGQIQAPVCSIFNCY